jgi:integrase
MAETQGQGSIVQLEKDKPRSKCRRWQLRVCVGKDPRTGKYKTRTRRFQGTYTEAKAALREFIAEIEGDRVQGRTAYTLEAYCERFLERRELNREVAPTTLKRQRWQFKVVNRLIGKARLEEVTGTMLDDAYAAMLRGDTPSGRPAGGSYVKQIHDNIRLVFAQAIKEGLIVRNPCDDANPPRMDTKEKKALTPDQYRAFIDSLDPREEHDMAYLLAACLGLRRGEVCGLSWGDIDFERRIVDISHSFDTLGNLKATKTKAGMRLLPLTEDVAQALLDHKQAQLERFQRTNKWRKPEEGYLVQDEGTAVICGEYGNRITPAALSRWWTDDREGFDLAGWCLHELRHSYLTMLALSGVHPKVMQELAGHYSSQITMDIYTHVNMDAKRKAAEAVAMAF